MSSSVKKQEIHLEKEGEEGSEHENSQGREDGVGGSAGGWGGSRGRRCHGYGRRLEEDASDGRVGDTDDALCVTSAGVTSSAGTVIRVGVGDEAATDDGLVLGGLEHGHGVEGTIKVLESTDLVVGGGVTHIAGVVGCGNAGPAVNTRVEGVKVGASVGAGRAIAQITIVVNVHTIDAQAGQVGNHVHRGHRVGLLEGHRTRLTSRCTRSGGGKNTNGG